MSVLFIIIGIVMVLWGADRLTDGATAIAHRLNVPQIVIGLTVEGCPVCGGCLADAGCNES